MPSQYLIRKKLDFKLIIWLSTVKSSPTQLNWLLTVTDPVHCACETIVFWNGKYSNTTHIYKISPESKNSDLKTPDLVKKPSSGNTGNDGGWVEVLHVEMTGWSMHIASSVEHDPVSGSRSNRILQFRTGPGVKRNFWPLRNFWPVSVFQLFCFSG